MSSGEAKYSGSIDLRHLRYFVAAVEHGSFRQAGAALGVQQSALSRRIRDLEHYVGAALFHRHSSGVRPTFAGQRFFRRARLIIRSVGEGVRDVSAIGRSEYGRLKIGIYSSLASGFLAELLGRYGELCPKIQMDLIDDNPAEHIAAIRQFRIDIAFVTGERTWRDCETVPLWTERVFVVLPSDHDLASEAEIDWQQLVEERFIVNDAAPGQEIHDYLVQNLAGLGHHPAIRIQHVGRENLLSLVALKRGLTVVSEAMTAAQFPGIIYRPIIREILPFSAVWSPRNDNPALKRILELARSKASERLADLIPTQSALTNAGPLQTPDPLP